MKTKLMIRQIGIILLFIIVDLIGLRAQNPTYTCDLMNDIQVDSKTYEFDVYLKRTGSVVLEMANIQFGLTLNSQVINGGTISPILVAGTSELNPAQIPGAAKFTFQSSKNCITLTAVANPGAGSGTIISNLNNGTRIGRFRITNSVDFAAFQPNLTWTWTIQTGYPTSLSAYVAGSPTSVPVQTSFTTSKLVNPILNKPIAAQTVTGAGSYCQGNTGLVVGLAGSEVGVTYTLYKDAVATATTVIGTGSAVSFPAQTAGTYTVKASYVNGANTWGTTDMTGSAVVTETPSLTAGVSIAAGANNICSGTSVTFTATPTNGGTTPSYQWYNGTTAVGTNSATYTYAPASGDVIKVVMTSNATPCLVGSPVTSNTVTMVVNPNLTAGVSIAAGANNICSGTSVTFTATPTNGGTTPSYQWYNGTTAVGTNSATYTYAPASGDVIKVVMTSNATPCLVGSPVTSNTVTMVVNPNLTAGVSIAAGANNICSGTSVTFTATPTNGGTSPSYQWYNGTTAVGTNSATYTYAPASGDVIKVVMTSNATPCLVGSPVTSNTVTMVVIPTQTAGVSVSPSANGVCSGTSVTFTATPTNGGTSPSYQWYNGITAVGTNSATYSYTPANGDVIKVVMTSNATPCLVGSPVTSNIVTMVVNPNLTAGVSIAAGANNICSGTSVTFTATPTNGGTTPSYQWYNGTTAVGTNSATYTYTPTNGEVIKVVMTSNATPCLVGSPVTSNTVTMVVNPNLTAGVSIAAGANNICSGTSVTFTANPTNGGTSPSYQWYKGTTAVGTNSATYTYAPTNGDVIKVVMTSNATPCLVGSPVTSNTVTMVVIPTQTAGVSVSPSANGVCSGTSVTFTATPTNGGTSPSYQWYIGLTAVGTNSATYTYPPTSGDVIKVVMISNATPCLIGSPVTSNTVSMVVNPEISSGVSIQADVNPAIKGHNVTFTATPVGGGTSPYYQWFVNNTQVGTNNSGIYTYSPANNDQVYALMTSNASPCLVGSPSTSNTITMSVVVTGIDESKLVSIYTYSLNMNIYVNCSEKAKQIQVYNTLGSLIYETNNVEGLQKIDMITQPIEYYFLKIVTSDNVFTRKVLLHK